MLSNRKPREVATTAPDVRCPEETAPPTPPAEVAAALERLYGLDFGGKPQGRFRISRKFLRQLMGRRRISDDAVQALADEVFERGFVLIDLDTHYAFIEQRVFNSYRRVTQEAVHSPGNSIVDTD